MPKAIKSQFLIQSNENSHFQSYRSMFDIYVNKKTVTCKGANFQKYFQNNFQKINVFQGLALKKNQKTLYS